MRIERRYLAILIVFITAAVCLLSVSAFAQAGGASLTIAKRGYTPGESITVTYAAPAGLPTDAWIGVIPSSTPHGNEEVNDQYDVSYQYLNGSSYGTMTFTAPKTLGSYDLRMNSANYNGVELAYVTFTVSAAPTNASLRLSTYSVSPGAPIAVTFTAPAGLASDAWIGIIPSWVAHGSEATNDQYDLSYQYLSGSSAGTLYFNAPTTPGSYDFRMHNTNSNGIELTSVTFSVR